MAVIRRYLLAFAFLLLLERPAPAKTDLDLVVNSLYQSGKGGKQVYDGSGNQSLTLYEPVLYINSQIDHNTSIFGSVVFDALSSASAKAFDQGTGASRPASDASTGASGGESDEKLFGGWQTRVGAELGYSKKAGTWVFTPTAGYSHELSYNSVHGGMNVQKFLAEDNFVLSAGYFHFSDKSRPWDVQNSKFSAFKAKTTNSVNAGATQILSEKDIVLAGVSYTEQTGFLEGTRNTVSTGTVTERALERLPGSRGKWTANTRYVRSLGERTAFHLDYRYYADNWNIRSHTWEPSLAFSFAEEAGTWRVFYRRYSQTAAKYYGDSFPAVTAYMTSDSDLSGFYANEVGAQAAYAPETEGGETAWEYGGTAMYYRRSNDLSALVLQASITAKF